MNLNNKVFTVNTIITVLVNFVFKLCDKWPLLESLEGNDSSVNQAVGTV